LREVAEENISVLESLLLSAFVVGCFFLLIALFFIIWHLGHTWINYTIGGWQQ
jgi:hypothetical protein